MAHVLGDVSRFLGLDEESFSIARRDHEKWEWDPLIRDEKKFFDILTSQLCHNQRLTKEEARWLISQVYIHESEPTEEEAIAAQAQAFPATKRIDLELDFNNRRLSQDRFLLQLKDHTEILAAVNALTFTPQVIDQIRTITVVIGPLLEKAWVKDDRLVIFVDENKQDSGSVLSTVEHHLGWDIDKTFESALPYNQRHLVFSVNDFGAINVILHERMAGMGIWCLS